MRVCSDIFIPNDGEGEHRRMHRRIARLFPELKDHEVRHLSNLVGNSIRKVKTDVYYIELQTSPFKYEPGYYDHFVVEHQFNRRHWSRLFLGPKTYVIYARATID